MSEPRMYGWRMSPYDPRDYHFAAAEHVVTSLPPSVDLSFPAVPAPFSPAWDQGQIGSCGPNSCSADIVFAALRQQSLSSAPMPSRLFVYYVARMLMGTTSQDSGVDNRSMLKALAQYGWCDESLWPYAIAKLTTKPPQSAFDQATTRKIVQYLAVPQDLDQMRSCLAGGDPFIYGFTVYQSFESDAVAKSGMVPMPRSGEPVLGGHDVLIVGYDDARQAFKFRNSWGPNWGLQGYAWMPYAYATNAKLSGDFWTVRHSGIVGPTPRKHVLQLTGDHDVTTVNGVMTVGFDAALLDGKQVA